MVRGSRSSSSGSELLGHVIVRVRASDPTAASLASHRFLEAAGAVSHALLLVVVAASGDRVLLLDKKRDLGARRLYEELTSEERVVDVAKKIRFADLFGILAVSSIAAERSVFEKMRAEYLAYAVDVEHEDRFLRATDGIVREIVETKGLPDAADYLRKRDARAQSLRKLTTDATFPFVRVGAVGVAPLALDEARVFDYGGEGSVHYVVAGAQT